VCCGFRRWKIARATMNTFMLPSSAALTHPFFTCHLRVSAGGGTRVPPRSF